MKVQILSYEPKGGWILYDFAKRLTDSLVPFCDEVELTHDQTSGFDITFHVNYWGLKSISTSGVHCTYITHIDNPKKFALVDAHASAGVFGICVSAETQRRLTTLTGKSLFSSVTPVSMMSPPDFKKTFLVASRCYPDGRKNEPWVIDFLSQLPSDLVQIKIMGDGWEGAVKTLLAKGFAVSFEEEFDRGSYRRLLETSDYLIYAGFDEGAISVLDALAFGVTPIVSAQGFHLDFSNDVILFNSMGELYDIAARVSRDLVCRKRSLDEITNWQLFAKKYVDIWSALL